MLNSDFRQKNMFYWKKKILKFDQSEPFINKLVKLGRKLKKRQTQGLFLFNNSHLSIYLVIN